MDIIKIEKEAFVLDGAERKKLLACLQYCKHRIKKHNAVNKGFDEKFVDYFIGFLKDEESD